jgi:hypothetical protein
MFKIIAFFIMTLFDWLYARVGIILPDSKDKANILNKQFQMAFSTKTEVSDESFKKPAT